MWALFPARTFCSICKFCFKQPEASAKERSKSSCKPDKCFNRRCKLCSQSQLLSVCTPSPVKTSAVSIAKVPTMWQCYHKQGSNLSKGLILHLGPLRRKSRQVHKVSPLERPASTSLVVTPVPFAPTGDMFLPHGP